jgi:glucose-6-phosphate dehydrogenase assembly protein OpcA
LNEAYRAISGEVLKNATARITVRIHPTIPMRVPDWWKNTSPANITRIGRIARKQDKYRFKDAPVTS